MQQNKYRKKWINELFERRVFWLILSVFASVLIWVFYTTNYGGEETKTFYDVEGSINAASEKLFIHKNTLQYKLNKIAEKTGYNPRSIRHSSLFYIAIYFYRETRDAMLKME